MALDLAHPSGARAPRLGVAMRRRRMRVWIVTGIFVGFVGVAWAWAFQRAPSVSAGGGLTVLVADSHPTRERPTDPGGMQVPDIDPLSYDSGRAPPQVENILPAPEEPLPQPMPPPPPPPVVARAAVPTVTAPDVPPPGAMPSPAVTAQAPAATPVRVALMAPPPPPPKPRPPRIATARPVPTPAAGQRTRQNPVPAIHDAAKPKPRPAAPPPRTVASGGSGYLQLAAVRSATDALQIGRRLRQRYGDLLRPFAFNYTPVDLGPRGVFYRIMAGPMAAGRASEVCQSLKRRGADCLVAGP